jgi:hypothetical protein
MKKYKNSIVRLDITAQTRLTLRAGAFVDFMYIMTKSYTFRPAL